MDPKPAYCLVHGEIIDCRECFWWYKGECQYSPEEEEALEAMMLKDIEEDNS